MRHVSNLMANENLGKLIQAQRLLTQASNLYSEVFSEEGAPAEVESEQEAFFNAVADCEKKIERLIGAVVYHDLFSPEYHEK